MGDHVMAYDPYNHPIKRKRGPWLWIVAIVLAGGFCLAGVLALAATPEVGRGIATVTESAYGPANTSTGEAPVVVESTAPPSTEPAAPVKTTKATKAAPAPVTIEGDTIVHVGEDVPAGTYRAAESVSGMDCYWSKSSDAEGDDIIDNDLPAGGRPQVTLKKGQWFTSSRCSAWVKK